MHDMDSNMDRNSGVDLSHLKTPGKQAWQSPTLNNLQAQETEFGIYIGADNTFSDS
jgi:hypothetical protein